MNSKASDDSDDSLLHRILYTGSVGEFSVKNHSFRECYSRSRNNCYFIIIIIIGYTMRFRIIA